MVYLVQIGSSREVAFARDIDKAYGAAFDRARAAGVEAVGLVCRITREAIEPSHVVPVIG
jgi:sugar fermentation stimulation protein A